MESAWFYQAVKYTPEGMRIEKTEALPCCICLHTFVTWKSLYIFTEQLWPALKLWQADPGRKLI